MKKTGKKFLGAAAFQVIRMLVILIILSMVTFFLLSISPIDPVKTNVGQAALASMSPEQVAKLEEYWGAGVPFPVRYRNWVADLLRGDLGISLLYRQPVVRVIGEKLSNSVILLSAAWVLSGITGVFLGMMAGRKRGGIADKLVTGYSLLTSSTPSFWVAMMLLMVFAVKFPIFPIGLSVPIGMAAEDVSFMDRIYHAVLPAVTLSITGIGPIALHTREKMIEAMESEYVLFARARGESETRILMAHGFRNIILPAMTLQFASISEIIGGSVLVEQVFSYPGLGAAAVAAGLGSDIPLLMGITISMAGMVFAGNLAANLLYSVVDPRIREGAVK